MPVDFAFGIALDDGGREIELNADSFRDKRLRMGFDDILDERLQVAVHYLKDETRRPMFLLLAEHK